MLKKALGAPDRWTYSDLAIAPPKADEFEALDLYHATTGGEEALKRKADRRKRQMLVYDEKLGKVVAKRKRKGGRARGDWEDQIEE